MTEKRGLQLIPCTMLHKYVAIVIAIAVLAVAATTRSPLVACAFPTAPTLRTNVAGGSLATAAIVKTQQNMVSLVEHWVANNSERRLGNNPNHHSRGGKTALIDNCSDTSLRELDTNTNLAVRKNMLLGQIDLVQRELASQKIQYEKLACQRQEELQETEARVLKQDWTQLHQELANCEGYGAEQNIEQRVGMAVECCGMKMKCDQQKDELNELTSQSDLVKQEMVDMQSDLVRLMFQLKDAEKALASTKQDREEDLLRTQEELKTKKQFGELQVGKVLHKGRAQQASVTEHYTLKIQESEDVLRNEFNLLREGRFDCRSLDNRIDRLQHDRTCLTKTVALVLKVLLQRACIMAWIATMLVFRQLKLRVWEHPNVQRRIHDLRKNACERLPKLTVSTLLLLFQRMWNLTSAVVSYLWKHVWQHPDVRRGLHSVRHLVLNRLPKMAHSALQLLFQRGLYVVSSISVFFVQKFERYVWQNPKIQHNLPKLRTWVDIKLLHPTRQMWRTNRLREGRGHVIDY